MFFLWATFTYSPQQSGLGKLGFAALSVAAITLVSACTDRRVGFLGDDSEAPSVPTYLVPGQVNSNQASVNWGAAKDNSGVVGYELFVDGRLTSETEENTFLLTQLKPATTYTIQVRAVDESSNTSAFTPALKLTTPTANPLTARALVAVDSEPPSIPTNVRATSIGRSHITLYWNPSTDNIGVTTYRVFDRRTLLATTNTSTLQLSGLIAETRYDIQVQAVDAVGNASPMTPILGVTTLNGLAIQTFHGVELYAQMCTSCHGTNGAGVGATVGLTRPISLAELTTIIETTMPPADPAACVADCAATVAQYVFNTFTNQNPVPQTDPLAGFPIGTQQIANVCARIAAANRSDVVRDAFCGATPPNISSLTQLQTALGLAFTNATAGRRNNGANGNPAFALTGHSSSLVARQVNALNPRAIIFTPPPGRGRRGGGNAPAGFVAMGFVRGDQFAEIVAADRNNNNAINFYLVRFTNACNATNSCTPADLLTPAVESNWTSFTVFDQVDLANTVLDCLQCHQVNGPGTPSILRMQELAVPWAHWLRSNTASSVLIDDFVAAHGTAESYAGIPAALINASDPRLLENLVRSAGDVQPNQFNSRAIQSEVAASAPGQPADNTTPGRSATWNGIYAASVSAQQIAVPYHDIKVTDPAQLQTLIQSYQGFVSGAVSPTALPDLREAFYTAQLRDIGFKVQAGLDGQGIIRQACGQCHNSRLDQTITRARFNIDLNAMSNTIGGVLVGPDRDSEIGLAINRLQLPPEDVRKMPPELFRSLDPAEINLAISYLCSQTTSLISQCAGR